MCDNCTCEKEESNMEHWISKEWLLEMMKELIEIEDRNRETITQPHLCLESVGCVRGINQLRRLIESR